MIKPRIPRINWEHPTTKGLIFEAGFFDRGGLAPLDTISKNGSSTLTLGTGGWVNDLYGSTMSFDGTTTNLFWNTRAYQDNLTKVSYEALVLIKGNGGGALGRLFVKSNGNAPGYLMCNINGTSLSLNTQNATTNGQWNVAQPSSNVWHHLVFTLDEAAQPAVIYVDGISQTLTTNTSSVGAHQGESAHLYIGNTQSGARGWNGYIAYLRQYNRILQAQEVRQLYTNPWQIYAQPRPQALNSVASFNANNASFFAMF